MAKIILEDHELLEESMLKHLKSLGFKVTASEMQSGARAAWLSGADADMTKLHAHVSKLDPSAKEFKMPSIGHHEIGGTYKGHSYSIQKHGQNSIHLRIHKKGEKGKLDKAGYEESTMSEMFGMHHNYYEDEADWRHFVGQKHGYHEVSIEKEHESGLLVARKRWNKNVVGTYDPSYGGHVLNKDHGFKHYNDAIKFVGDHS